MDIQISPGIKTVDSGIVQDHRINIRVAVDPFVQLKLLVGLLESIQRRAVEHRDDIMVHKQVEGLGIDHFAQQANVGVHLGEHLHVGVILGFPDGFLRIPVQGQGGEG
ncbi:hypothetical protein D3C76_1586520 [compost metagenome]